MPIVCRTWNSLVHFRMPRSVTPITVPIDPISRSLAMKLFNVFIREYQIIRFSIEVETDGDLRAAIAQARLQYEKSGTQFSAHAEIEIDDAEIFGVDEVDPTTGGIMSSRDFESISASVGQPIDLEN